MKCKVLHSVSSQRNAACLGVIIFGLACRAGAQVVTIDFDYPNPLLYPRVYPPDWNLPWSEEGYTVFSERGGGASLQGQVPSVSAPPPYPGFLEVHNGWGSRAGYALITNNAALPFDLLALEVLKVGVGLGSLTNYASIISSAGGVFSLLGTPDATTVHFPNDSRWQNLTFVRIEFLTPTFPAEGLQLDNVVLRTVPVPEPALLGAGILVLFARLPVRRPNSFG